MAEPLPVVEPRDVPAAQLRVSLSTYRWLFGEEGWASARSYASAIGDALSAVEPRWLGELATWAEAAGTDIEDLLVLNARSELLSLVRAERRRGECTVVAEPGRLAQTWDWFGRQRAAVVVLRSDGLVTLTEAGMLAKIGVNQHGLAVGLTYLTSSSDAAPNGRSLPVHAVLRLLLERSSSVASAVGVLDEVQLAGSACIALADPESAALVEVTPTDRAVLPHGVHTNHCLDPVLRRLQGAVAFLADSETRLRRATSLCRAGAGVEDLLADTSDGYDAIDQPPDPSLDLLDRTETVLAVIVEPEARCLRIAPGRPSLTGFSQRVELCPTSSSCQARAD